LCPVNQFHVTTYTKSTQFATDGTASFDRCQHIVQRMHDESGDQDGDGVAGQQRRRQSGGEWWHRAGARRSGVDITGVLAAAGRTGGPAGRRGHTVDAQSLRFVHLQATRRVRCADLVDRQLLSHVCAPRQHSTRRIILFSGRITTSKTDRGHISRQSFRKFRKINCLCV